jgi:hypothetical protein
MVTGWEESQVPRLEKEIQSLELENQKLEEETHAARMIAGDIQRLEWKIQYLNIENTLNALAVGIYKASWYFVIEHPEEWKQILLKQKQLEAEFNEVSKMCTQYNDELAKFTESDEQAPWERWNKLAGQINQKLEQLKQRLDERGNSSEFKMWDEYWAKIWKPEKNVNKK